MANEIWRKKRFFPLLATQFLGAFNDNLFKNTLMVFIAYKLLADAQTVNIYANLAAGIFILPYRARSFRTDCGNSTRIL